VNTRWQLEQLLGTWLDADGPTEEVPVVVPCPYSPWDRHAHVEDWPVSAVLYELWDDDCPLPPETAGRLGLPAACTFSDAARLLWSLREELWFPGQTYQEIARCLTSLPSTAVASLVETLRTHGERLHERGNQVATPAHSPEVRPARARWLRPGTPSSRVQPSLSSAQPST
jgi:hypothetical protein